MTDTEGKARDGPQPGSYSSFVRLQLDDAALHGLPGQVVTTLLPHTEADPAALLLTFLTMLGNACGPGPALEVGADAHPGRLYTVLVGDTSTGRKGSAGSQIERLFDMAVPDWAGPRVERGIQSAEAVIVRVADMSRDPRLLLEEHEFARLLMTMATRGNLSPVLREAWDGRPLAIVTKRNAIRLGARRAHISVLGHITAPELAERLAGTDINSGFANRFLFALVNRSKLLPRGGALTTETLDGLAEKIEEVVGFSTDYALGHLDPISKILCQFHGVFPTVPMGRTDAFWDRWDQLYTTEFERRLPGTPGIVTSRVAAQVLRLSVVYALADLCDTVDVQHLEAALAVWRYCEESVKFIFGTITGNREADKVIRALHDHALSRTDISVLFGRNKNRRQLDLILAEVMGTGMVRSYPEGEGAKRKDMYALITEQEEDEGADSRKAGAAARSRSRSRASTGA